MSFLGHVQASRMITADNSIRTLAGSEHWVVIRKFVAPELDPTWKEDPMAQQTPSKEFAILAKVRALSENEMLSTEIGMIKKGDLFIAVDPAAQVLNLDEVRFRVDTQLDGGVGISHTWDYVVHDVKRTDFGGMTVAKTFLARRKTEQTAGGSGNL